MQAAPASSRHFASGGFAFVGLLLVTFALQGGTQPTRESSAASVKAYFHAHAVFLTAICVLNRRARFSPRWTDYLGSATAVAFVLGATGIATETNTMVTIAYAATAAWCLWVAAVSVSMWRRHA